MQKILYRQHFKNITDHNKKLSLQSRLYVVFAFFTVLFFTGFPAITPDRGGYENWLAVQGGEGIIFWLANHVGGEPLQKYNVIHLTTISTSLVLCVFFVSELTKFSILPLLGFIALTYLFFVTQIRFYPAALLMALALYLLTVKRKAYFGVLIASAATLIHPASFLMLPYLVIWRPAKGKKLVVIAVGAVVLYLLFRYVIVGFFQSNQYLSIGFSDLSRFGNYFSEYNRPSVGGWIWTLIPYFISSSVTLWFILGAQGRSVIEYFNNCGCARKIRFAINLAFLPFIFLIVSFDMTIVARRLLNIALLFQCILIWNVLYYGKNDKINARFVFTVIVGGLFLVFYFRNLLVGLEPRTFYRAKEVFLSNGFF